MDRKEQVREAYRALREAGYTAEEARILRSKNQEVVAQAIAVKQGQTAEQAEEAASQWRGNKQRRVSPEEGVLLDCIREAGIEPGVVLEILSDTLSSWRGHWDPEKPGGAIMIRQLERQLEAIRKGLASKGEESEETTEAQNGPVAGEKEEVLVIAPALKGKRGEKAERVGLQ